MNTRPRSLPAIAAGLFAIACAWSTAFAQTFDADGDAVFRKMLALNHGLDSYTAHVDVKTHFAIGGFTLHGTLYERGDDVKVVFDNVPGIARHMVDDQPSLGPATGWSKRYAIDVSSRTPETTTYHLVPLAHCAAPAACGQGNVKSIDATVDNATGLISKILWANANGTTITSDQTYAPVDGYELVASGSSKTRGGPLSADSFATFSDYRLNVAIPDSVFTASP